MVGTSRRREAHFRLKRAARESVIASAHERPVDLQSDGTTKGLKLTGRYFEIHRNSIDLVGQIVNIDQTTVSDHVPPVASHI